jgi:hypothetical protein
MMLDAVIDYLPSPLMLSHITLLTLIGNEEVELMLVMTSHLLL